MGVIGIEEIFLKVKDMEKALDFYHGIVGLPIDKQDGERTYLQAERGHIVLQIENHTGRHQGGGPTSPSPSARRPSTRFWRSSPAAHTSPAAPTASAARAGRSL